MKWEYLIGNKGYFNASPDSNATHCLISDLSSVRAWSNGFAEYSVVTFLSGATCRLDPQKWSILAERRAVWDGEGLPPVGTKCEVRISSNSPWFECEIVYSGESGAAFISTKDNSIDCVNASCPDFFRPLRSPEDVARDESINAMRKVWWEYPGKEHNGKVFSIYEIIYDAIAAGKIPGVKLEGK